MEIPRVGLEQIANTGVDVTIEYVGSNTWKKSALLAAEIANNPEYQIAVVEAVQKIREQLDPNVAADAITKCSKIVREKFSKRQYFDSSVEHAAFSAVLAEINKSESSS